MSKARSIESLRGMLNDRERMLAFIDSTSARDRERGEHVGAKYDRFYEYTASIARRSAECVFKHSESPIETMFLNSLVVGFLLSDPTNLNVLPPPARDIVEGVKNRREYLELCQQWYWMFQQLADTDSLDGFHLFLEDRVREGSFTKDAADEMYGMVLVMEATHLQQSFHLVMQAPFPNVVVNGRSVRADAYFWIPSDPTFNLIVECDGYEYHSDQATFERDRKRDRAFAAAGYRVLRFSGGEIYADPIGKSRELFDFLQNHSKLFTPPAEIAIPEDLKEALRAKVEDFMSYYPPDRYQHPETVEPEPPASQRPQ